MNISASAFKLFIYKKTSLHLSSKQLKSIEQNHHANFCFFYFRADAVTTSPKPYPFVDIDVVVVET